LRARAAHPTRRQRVRGASDSGGSSGGVRRRAWPRWWRCGIRVQARARGWKAAAATTAGSQNLPQTHHTQTGLLNRTSALLTHTSQSYMQHVNAPFPAVDNTLAALSIPHRVRSHALHARAGRKRERRTLAPHRRCTTTDIQTRLSKRTRVRTSAIRCARPRARASVNTPRIQTHADTDTQTHRHTDTQTHRHTDTQTHRHTETQTHRQTHRHSETQTQIHICTHIHIRVYMQNQQATHAARTVPNLGDHAIKLTVTHRGAVTVVLTPGARLP
jgi:hypothetical protein